MELQAKTLKIFESKGLIVKIFRNKDLCCQRTLKMALGQLREPSYMTDVPRNCPNQTSSIARGGLEVNDFRRRWFAMKKAVPSYPAQLSVEHLRPKSSPLAVARHLWLHPLDLQHGHVTFNETAEDGY
jgi:hypothetical protein